MKNIEIKYRQESGEDLKIFFLKIPGVRFIWTKDQTDTYYTVPKGKLKLRIQTDENAELIFYVRNDSVKPRNSHYQIYHSQKPELLHNILENAFGTDVIIEKQRTLLIYKNVRIHIDNVKYLGKFLELESVIYEGIKETEAKQNIESLQDYICGLKLKPVPFSYSELLDKKSGSSQ